MYEQYSEKVKNTPIQRRGRGSLTNITGRFEALKHEDFHDGWSDYESPESKIRTYWRDDTNRTIITQNQSPDIHFDRSINPYRGCEHGCIYCFARPSHTYLGHSAGLDFETRLYAKREAAKLLRTVLSKRSYVCEPIAIGVNTDAYQPLEKKLRITRELLEVMLEFRQPAYLITKSTLIERDIDLLQKMAKMDLVSVCITITTLDKKLARALEPRVPVPARRLETIKNLAEAGIPTRVSMSPIIPALNEEEIDDLIKSAAQAGAQAAYAILLRLPHELQQLFPQWLEQHYPLRAARIMKAIRSLRGNRLNDPSFGTRMQGSGPRADVIQRRFELACKRHGVTVGRDFKLDCSHFAAGQQELAFS